MYKKRCVKLLKGQLKSLEKYPLELDDNVTDKPIVIFGPDGTNKNQLRLYAYGGDIGLVPLGKKAKYELAKDKKYANYICTETDRKEMDEKDIKAEAPEWLTKQKVVIDELKDTINTPRKLLLSCYNKNKSKEELLKAEKDNDYYLPLILAAQIKKWTKKDGKTKKERRVQCEIAKIYQKKCGKRDGKDFIVTDIEFKFPLTPKRCKEKGKGTDSKPDFVVFDGYSFGLIELKYNGEGYSDNNDLNVHFNDFYDLIYDETDEIRWEKYGECLRRLAILLKLGVLGTDENRKKWLECLKKQRKFYKLNKNGSFRNELFWFGFYFVGGKKKANNRIKSRLIEDEEINCKLKAIKVYAGYCEKVKEEDYIFNLDKVIEADNKEDLFTSNYP